MTIDTERFRTILQEERERVQAAIQNLHDDHPGSLDDETEEISTGADNHIADTATATLDREIDYTLGENSEHVLGEIEAALARVDDGTYGMCTHCGSPIAEARLEAQPWSTLCIDCKRRLERR
jgi:RNA polymerase-binding protein DksA